ncbi:MAG: hypothetical protein ACM3SP_19285 [Chloroflexota bacterium]
MSPTVNFAANHDLNLIFEPDTLVPEQFYATLKSSYLPDPERRLMAAMLEDAVACLSRDPRRCTRQQRRSFASAQQWINATDEENWIFSFTNVCEMLGLDPSYLRRGLTQWAESAQMHRSPARCLKKYRSGARQRKLRFRMAR